MLRTATSRGDRNATTLLAILRGAPPGAWPEPVSSEEFAEITVAHRLGAFVSARMGPRLDVLPPWAAEARLRLEAMAMAGTARWRGLDGAAADVAAALAGAGVEGLWFKGYALARDVYASPEERPSGDLDVLVRERDVPAAARALEAAGFMAGAPQRVGPMERSFVRRREGEPVVDVDLHWKFVGPESLIREMRVDPEPIMARARTVRPGMLFPALEDAFILGAANLASHAFGPLGQYLDFARLAARGPDWEVVSKRATETRTRAALGAALAVAGDLFAAPVPGEVLRRLRPAWWQRVAFGWLLAPPQLADPGAPSTARMRYLSKILAQDSLAATARTLAGAPRGLLLRVRRGKGR